MTDATALDAPLVDGDDPIRTRLLPALLVALLAADVATYSALRSFLYSRTDDALQQSAASLPPGSGGIPLGDQGSRGALSPQPVGRDDDLVVAGDEHDRGERDRFAGRAGELLHRDDLSGRDPVLLTPGRDDRLFHESSPFEDRDDR